MLPSGILTERDLRHIWHPCTPMKDHEVIPLVEVAAASGCYLHTTDGRKIFDAISSWWCKSLGHQHPHIKAAIQNQLDCLEHVILAGTTNETIVTLSELLARLMPTLNKVLFASDGSCAVEMALKLSLHAHQIAGQHQRTEFLSLMNAYHGETVGAMSVSDLGAFCKPYESLLFPVTSIRVPYVSDRNQAQWFDCSDHWAKILPTLEQAADTTAALIVEPIVQGANGMRLYSQDFLHRLRAWTTERGIHLIADEVMTGCGRTGKMLACEHANIVPDFLCLSKGLTAGFLPLSVTLTSQTIYDLFYDDAAAGKTFWHSHTHSGNTLAASAAVATLQLIKAQNIVAQAAQLENRMLTAMQNIAADTKLLHNVRGIGAIVAADLIMTQNNSRTGMEMYHNGLKHGILLRPLGNTLYWFPPLIMTSDELQELEQRTRAALVE